MPVSEAQKKASARYLENLDEVRIRMPKGKKATIQAHAAAQGESVNSFINRAIDQTIAQEAAGSRTRAAEVEVVLDTTEGENGVPGASTGRTEGMHREDGA